MKRFLALVILWIASVGLCAQDAAALAAQRDAEERERRMGAAMEELRQANLVQQRRINELINENGSLHRLVTDLENRFRNAQMGAVSREDLQKVYAKMAEIEKARQTDRASLLEQINKVAELAAKQPQIIQVPVPAPATTTKASTRTEREPTGDKEPEAPPENPDGYFKHKIKNGENLTTIIAAYNAELKEKSPAKKAITLDAVLKANPKMKPNNLQPGKEILIPVPPNK